jgi:excisionase family DNA binding protein
VASKRASQSFVRRPATRAHRLAPRHSAATMTERFLTLTEAAHVLRLHPRTVREYVQRGELRGRLIGRRWRFRQKDLDVFFDSARPQWVFTVGKGGDEE